MFNKYVTIHDHTEDSSMFFRSMVSSTCTLASPSISVLSFVIDDFSDIVSSWFATSADLVTPSVVLSSSTCISL